MEDTPTSCDHDEDQRPQIHPDDDPNGIAAANGTQAIDRLLTWAEQLQHASDVAQVDMRCDNEGGVQIRMKFRSTPRTAAISETQLLHLAASTAVRYPRRRHLPMPPTPLKSRQLPPTARRAALDRLLGNCQDASSVPYTNGGELRPRPPHRHREKPTGTQSKGGSADRDRATPPKDVGRDEAGLGSAENDDDG